MQIRVQNKRNSVRKSRYVGDVSIDPVEQRLDDEMDEDDPLWFLNIGAYDDDVEMMSHPYDDSGY